MKVMKQKKPLVIKPRSPRSRWVAIDANDKIIAEGVKGEVVIRKAEKITDQYTLAWVERENEIFIL